MASIFLKGLYGILDAPNRLRNRLRCLRLRESCAAHATAQFAAEAAVFNPVARSAITVGEQSLVICELLIIPPAGHISIGDWCYIGPGAKIWAMSSVTVGNRVFISHGVQIFDNNSHSLSAQERHDRYRELRTTGGHLQPEKVTTAAISIEDDVWIGFNVAILKGVTIGRGAVVGAGSVVLENVAPYTIVGGNPARKIGESRA